MIDVELLPFPPQPDGVPWPAPGFDGWPTGEAPAGVAELVDEVFGDFDRYGDTYAVAVVQGGRLLHERYGGALPSFVHEPTPVEPATPLLSWSMAKSILHLLVGTMVEDGLLDPTAAAPVPAWRDDERAAITLDHLLEMRDGLGWNEAYDVVNGSDVVEMLFGSGSSDVAAFAEARRAAHPPGTVFNYSSGTSNVVSAIVGRALGGRDEVEARLRRRLFEPLGITSADPRFDDAGTFLGSSYVYLTARDWCRLGLLALRGGTWDGRAVVPASWIDHGRRPRSVDEEKGRWYGAHWWVDNEEVERGTFTMQGYEGQSVAVCPALDAVVVRLGRTPEDTVGTEHLWPWRRRVLDALA